jgi:hypothetical protein
MQWRHDLSLIVVASMAVACSLLTDLSDLKATSDAANEAASDAPANGDGASDAGSDAEACAPITRVQAQSSVESTSVASTSVTMNLTTGNLAVAVIAAQGQGTLTIDDSSNATWTTLPQANNTTCADDSGVGSTRLRIAYTTVKQTASTVVTLSSSSDDILGLVVLEYSGALDFETSSMSIATSDTDKLASGAVTLSACASVVVAAFGDEFISNAITVDTPLVDAVKVPNWSLAVADALNVTPGALTPRATNPVPSDCWAATAAAFGR